MVYCHYLTDMCRLFSFGNIDQFKLYLQYLTTVLQLFVRFLQICPKYHISFFNSIDTNVTFTWTIFQFNQFIRYMAWISQIYLVLAFQFILDLNQSNEFILYIAWISHIYLVLAFWFMLHLNQTLYS